MPSPLSQTPSFSWCSCMLWNLWLTGPSEKWWLDHPKRLDHLTQLHRPAPFSKSLIIWFLFWVNSPPICIFSLHGEEQVGKSVSWATSEGWRFICGMSGTLQWNQHLSQRLQGRFSFLPGSWDRELLAWNILQYQCLYCIRYFYLKRSDFTIWE